MPKNNKENKLKIEDIKKNPDIEKKHFINKFIEHERIIMFLTTIVFMILICAVIYICSVIIEKDNKVEIYYDGSLKIEYNIDSSGVTDIVSLGEDNILDDLEGEKSDFSFRITNDSNSVVRYKIYLEEDDSMIRLDDCRDKLVNKDAIRFSINGEKESVLNRIDKDSYLILSGFVNPSKTKEYNLEVWIDKKSMKDINKNHFHGRIVVVNDEVV